MDMGRDRCSPEVERGLFAGADPQGSTEGFAAVEDGWAGAQGSTFLARGWAVDPAGAAQGSTEAAGLAPARRSSRKRTECSSLWKVFLGDWSPPGAFTPNSCWNGSSSSAPAFLWTTTAPGNSGQSREKKKTKQFPSLNLDTNTCSSKRKINLPLFLTVPAQVTIPGWRWPKSQGLFMSSGKGSL